MKKQLFITATILVSLYMMQSCQNANTNATISEPDITANPSLPKDSLGEDKILADNDLMFAMSNTLDEIKALKMTNNFDLDFAKTMILHNHAGIDICNVEVAQGRDEYIQLRAEDMITIQREQINQLNRFVGNYKPAVMKSQVDTQPSPIQTILKETIANMNNMQIKGDTDQDFAKMMIIHHRGTVQLAEAELANGKDAGLKKMAQQLVNAQSQEIESFQVWLNAQQ